MRLASKRIQRYSGAAETHIVADYSTAFLASRADAELDWAYLDTTHSYEDTKKELALLRQKVAPGGVIAGDDWHESEDHLHYGVAKAVKEALEEGAFEWIGAFPEMQWAIRRPA